MGAATENARSPKEVEDVLGVSSKHLSDERRVRGGIYGVRSSEIYEGAMLLRAFQVRRAVLYCILSRMGNQ